METVPFHFEVRPLICGGDANSNGKDQLFVVVNARRIPVYHHPNRSEAEKATRAIAEKLSRPPGFQTTGSVGAGVLAVKPRALHGSKKTAWRVRMKVERHLTKAPSNPSSFRNLPKIDGQEF